MFYQNGGNISVLFGFEEWLEEMISPTYIDMARPYYLLALHRLDIHCTATCDRPAYSPTHSATHSCPKHVEEIRLFAVKGRNFLWKERDHHLNILKNLAPFVASLVVVDLCPWPVIDRKATSFSVQL